MIALLAYIAIVVTVNAILGARRERHLARQVGLLGQQVDLLTKLQRGQASIGQSLAEVEVAATIHTASGPGAGVEETQRRRALRASQTDE